TITHTGSDAQTKSRSLVARGETLTAKLEPFASKASQRLRMVELAGKVKIDLDTVQISDKQEATAYKATVTGARATMTARMEGGKAEWTIHLA
ncbi:hypothetical protein ABTM81_19205, partial [Acinetobacter baumannii]